MEKTENGIYYDSDGSSDFALYPQKGTHKAKDIQRAKYWLKGKKGAERIQVRWNIRDEDNFSMPQKLPNEAILSAMRIEAGKRESYIQELEGELSRKDNMKLSNEEMIIFKADKVYKSQKEQITILQRKLKQSRKDISRLIGEIAKLGGFLPKGINIQEERDDISDT